MLFRKIKTTLLSLVTIVALTACGDDTNSLNSEESYKVEPYALASTDTINKNQYFRVISPKTCTQTNKNRFIYQVMHDSYLWDTSVPELDFKDREYNSSEKMLEALKSSHDKFSFVIDKKVAQSYFEEGKHDSFGFGLTVARFQEDTYALVIKFVYPNSPADKLGVKRGDIISLVNGQKITDDTLDEIIDILENQKSIEFTFWTKERTFKKTIAKAEFDIDPVLQTNYYANASNNKRVGYIVFQDFLSNATPRIDQVFNEFKAKNVNELVLDLRYNGGGSVTIANHLASLIGGTHTSEKIFHHVNFNDRYSKYNYSSRFEDYNSNALNLRRVFVLTTKQSCSASELVINALKASSNNLDVIQIGSATCGKPYGFVGAGIFCDQALYAINMETKNSDNVGDYTEGLTPTCQVKDDVFKEFGDKSEGLLKEALSYISTNRCSKESQKQEKLQEELEDEELPSLKEDGFKRIMNAY